MLRALRIKNLALVDDLRWELGAGLNTLTGETGAGKSMLLGGFNLLLGGRADKTLLRTGADTCSVEAEIEIAQPQRLNEIQILLESIGAEVCDGHELLLKRSFSASGTNKQFINGSPVTLAGLKQLGDLLVDVHGPHDHQSLLSTDTQRDLLDAYAQAGPTRKNVEEAHKKLLSIQRERAALEMSERERDEKIARLTEQTREIESAHLSATEDETVEHDYKVATHARQILELAQSITTLVNEAEPSILQQLALVEKNLHTWERLDPTAKSFSDTNQSIVSQLQDLSANIQDAAEKIDLDAGRLQQLEDRLNLIQSLKRKYGGTLSEVIAFGQSARAQLDSLQSHEASRAELAHQEKNAQAAFTKAAAALTSVRTKAALPLAKKVQEELQLLGFTKARFTIALSPAAPTANGADAIDFFFAPNVGEEAKPLRAIASSGEMARVMLAIKTTLAEVDAIPILIFDEVDANVGGETATQVGKKLAHLGSTHQVLCITHLPQVAAAGHHHFAVKKETKDGRTTTEVFKLEKTARVAELARMLGGQSEQAKALALALLGKK